MGADAHVVRRVARVPHETRSEVAVALAAIVRNDLPAAGDVALKDFVLRIADAILRGRAVRDGVAMGVIVGRDARAGRRVCAPAHALAGGRACGAVRDGKAMVRADAAPEALTADRRT